MYKGITLNQFIGELQKLAETRGEDELRSIGAASGKLFGLTSPYCLNFKDDKTEYIPAFAQDVRAHAVHAQGQGPSAKGQGAVSLRDDLNGADAQGAGGDLISREELKKNIAVSEDHDLIGRNGRLYIAFDIVRDAVLNTPAAAQALPAQGQEERAKGKGELHPKGTSSASPRARHVWARVGMTLDITPEEEKAIFEGDYSEGKEAVMRVIEAGRASVDGETYIPQECIEDFDDEYGTKYRDREDECAYHIDGLRVAASPIFEKEQPLVAEVIASAQERAVDATARENEKEFGIE